MIQPLRPSSLFLLVAFGAVACGGGAPPADPSTTAAPAPAATPAPAQPEPAAPEAAPTAAATTPAAPAPAEPEAIKRTMAERLFAPKLAFMVNYPVSAPKNAAEQSCGAKFPDPGAKAACMDKERGKFVADVLVFEKTDKGSTLTIFRRVGSTLAELSKSKIEVTEDTPERLGIKILSDKGWRPLYAGKKALAVSSRDDSSITVDDPQFGQLVYEARIGMLGSSQ